MPNATILATNTISFTMSMKSGPTNTSPSTNDVGRLPENNTLANGLQLQRSNKPCGSTQLIWVYTSTLHCLIDIIGATHGITSLPTPRNNDLINIGACSNIPLYIDVEKYKIEALLVGSHDTDIIGDTSWLNKLEPNHRNLGAMEINTRGSNYTIFNIRTALPSMTSNTTSIW